MLRTNRLFNSNSIYSINSFWYFFHLLVSRRKWWRHPVLDSSLLTSAAAHQISLFFLLLTLGFGHGSKPWRCFQDSPCPLTGRRSEQFPVNNGLYRSALFLMLLFNLLKHFFLYFWFWFQDICLSGFAHFLTLLIQSCFF